MMIGLGLILCLGLVSVHGDKQIGGNLLKTILGGIEDDNNYYDSAKGITYNIIFNPPDTSISCPDGKPSFQPHPADATKFLLCREGRVYYMFQCIPGYVFRSSDHTCVYLPGSLITTSLPHQQTPVPQEKTPVPYEQTPVPQEKTPVPYEQTPQPQEKIPLPVQETPKPPVFAFTGRPVGGFSLPPQGSVTGNPVYHVYRLATANPCQSAVATNQFYYAHPTDRTKYIQCDPYGDAFLKTCPENKYWHQQYLQCIQDGLYMGGTLIG